MPESATNLRSMERHTVAHAVGSTLARLGVDTVFGLAGSGNFVVTNALVAGGARFVAARHEGGAVAMADGWARTTGRVGIVTVHQGPGLTNTLTALAEAAKAHTPLVVLAGDTPAGALRSNFRIDQHDLVAAVGAAAELVYTAASAAADASRALRRAELERRPVVLMLPIDLQAQAAPAGDIAPPAPLPASPAPALTAITQAADLLQAAGRPAIIAGRGAVLAGAGAAIEALADRTGALVATSAMAHGLFAGSRYALGISGGFASPLAAELLADSDVVLAFGATLNHWTTQHRALLGPEVTLIQADIDAAAIGAHQPADVAIVGDAADAAQALLAELEARDHRAIGRRTPEIAEAIATRRWRDEPYDDAPAAGTIDPRTLAIALEDLLPADRAVAVDSGAFTGWPAMYLDVADPRGWLFCNAFQSVGLGPRRRPRGGGRAPRSHHAGRRRRRRPVPRAARARHRGPARPPRPHRRVERRRLRRRGPPLRPAGDGGRDRAVCGRRPRGHRSRRGRRGAHGPRGRRPRRRRRLGRGSARPAARRREGRSGHRRRVARRGLPPLTGAPR